MSAGLLLPFTLAADAAYAQEQWQTSSEQTCSRTSEAMAISLPELEGLFKSFGEQEKVIQTKEESLRKVYLMRLHLEWQGLGSGLVGRLPET